MMHQKYLKDHNRWQLFLREVVSSHESGELAEKALNRLDLPIHSSMSKKVREDEESKQEKLLNDRDEVIHMYK